MEGNSLRGCVRGTRGNVWALFVLQGMLLCCKEGRYGMTVCCALFHSWRTSYCRQLMSPPNTLVQYMRTTGDAVMAHIVGPSPHGNGFQHITQQMVQRGVVV